MSVVTFALLCMAIFVHHSYRKDNISPQRNYCRQYRVIKKVFFSAKIVSHTTQEQICSGLMTIA